MKTRKKKIKKLVQGKKTIRIKFDRKKTRGGWNLKK